MEQNFFNGASTPTQPSSQGGAQDFLPFLFNMASGGGAAAAAGGLPFGLLLALGGLFGGAQGGLGAFEAAQQQQAQRATATLNRARIEQLINELEDFSNNGLIAQANKNYNRAAGEIGANTAARGTYSSGNVGARALQAGALGDTIANLSQQEQQNQLARHQLVAQLLGNPAFQTPSSGINPGLASFLGLLGGGAGGAGQALGSTLSTDYGLTALANLGGK